MATKKVKIYQAKEPFFTPGRVYVEKGQIVKSDDPIFKGREHLFEEVVYLPASEVEAATAAPGEKRKATPKGK